MQGLKAAGREHHIVGISRFLDALDLAVERRRGDYDDPASLPALMPASIGFSSSLPPMWLAGGVSQGIIDSGRNYAVCTANYRVGFVPDWQLSLDSEFTIPVGDNKALSAVSSPTVLGLHRKAAATSRTPMGC